MKNRDSRGFTLLELLITISIIGIMSVLVMANFQYGRRANELRRAGTELLQNLRLAQGYTTGGNSIKYCEGGSIPQPNAFKPCADDTYCAPNSCITSVPLGGYGIHLESTGSYLLFGDTTKNQFYDDSNVDAAILLKDISIKGLYILQFKLGNGVALAPSPINPLDITFEPPNGDIHFYLHQVPAVDGDGDLINTLDLLVQSNFVTENCRKISINRISGQISEVQNPCSL
ncbi:MAG: prepilin-type N-terminal cleavage/methylation domain-containing protein [Patescibacteria group bacterium]|jgi:prepilin-type N-terminal cleavage/methylation domain-containing protein